MENILMRFCRETNHCTVKTVAAKLGVTIGEYIGMETGEILLSDAQAKKLGQIYNADPSYFNAEALQLDLLRTRIEIIKTLKAEINSLKQKTP